jgi:DNA repair ATPase RecN
MFKSENEPTKKVEDEKKREAEKMESILEEVDNFDLPEKDWNEIKQDLNEKKHFVYSSDLFNRLSGGIDSIYKNLYYDLYSTAIQNEDMKELQKIFEWHKNILTKKDDKILDIYKKIFDLSK